MRGGAAARSRRPPAEDAPGAGRRKSAPQMRNGRASCPAVRWSLLSVGPVHRPLAQGITPTMSAPMKANAQHTINALIGLVSPMP